MIRNEPSELRIQRRPTDAAATTPAGAFQKVVVGVDFSPASLRAARWVGTQLAPNATLVLAHVVARPVLPAYVRDVERRTLASDTVDTDGLSGGLHGLAETLGRERTQIVIRAGEAAPTLAAIAEEVGADLICIGRGPRPRESARFGGTTPIRLLAWTRIPTVVVPMIDLGDPSPIVAGLDDRAGGQRVLTVASTLARQLNASLDVVHVIEPEFRQFVESASGDRPRSMADAGSWLDERATQWAERCSAEAGYAERSAAVVRSGDPGQELMRHARGRRAGLIVVGQGGTAADASIPVGSLSPGSSTRLLLWASPCPVLVLPLAAARTRPTSPALTHATPVRRRAHPALRSERFTAPPSPTRIPHVDHH